ncbi:MAG: hypothetical protein K9L66_12055 [Spirochaetaceae bacterium]|nr:hypothetical protein [Spirochaetaceae bacterium]MCF7947816.1 hypothetical protein [Spirochaetia bacterium]MCF7952224.1 hypothetical protein [Spirochaetaceae bacterium]
MRLNKILITTMMIALVGAPVVFGAGAQEASDESFTERLDTALRNSGFTQEEVEAIIDSADESEWEAVEGGHAEAVARALSLAKDQEADLDPEQNAELALELAQNTIRLENENYEDTVVARATLEAVRSMLGRIEQWKSGDQSENLGEIVRERVSTEARKAAKKQASEQKKSAEEGKSKGSQAGDETPAGDTPGTSATD